MYVDTGAMYRAMALYLLRRNVNRENPDEIGEACQGAEISIAVSYTHLYRNLQSGVESAAASGYVDTVIAPADTSKYVIGAFEMLFTKREDRPAKKHSAV